MRVRVRSVLVLTVPVGVLVLLGSSAPRRVSAILAPTTFELLLADLCALAALLVAAWLCLLAVLVVALRVLAPESGCERAVARLTPRRWQAVLMGAIGASALMVPAAQADDGAAGVQPTTSSVAGLPLPDRPSSAAPLHATAPPPATADEPPVPRVVVRAGDTLWSIAATSLRAGGSDPSAKDVQRACRRWYAANRDAIGSDRDLIFPGTVLTGPMPHSRPPTQ